MWVREYKWLCYFNKIWFSCLTWYSTSFLFINNKLSKENNKSKKKITKTVCDSVNHTRFPKEDHLPDWEHRDIQVTKGDRVECFAINNTSVEWKQTSEVAARLLSLHTSAVITHCLVIALRNTRRDDTAVKATFLSTVNSRVVLGDPYLLCLLAPKSTTNIRSFFFFFLRRYNFGEVLSFSTNSFHLDRFLTRSFQLAILRFATSFSSSSSHLFLGLPSDLVNAGDHSYTLLTVLSSGIRCTCPNQVNLCALM